MNETSMNTLDYTAWFTTNPTTCLISQFYFSTSNVSPVSATVAGVNFVPNTKTFTVDTPTWFADPGKAVNTTTTFFLIAQGDPQGTFASVQLNFTK